MMDFDFELLLTVLVGLFGVGYALDVWLWKPARVKALALATLCADTAFFFYGAIPDSFRFYAAYPYCRRLYCGE